VDQIEKSTTEFRTGQEHKLADTLLADFKIAELIWLGGLEHGFYFSIYWECHHPN